VSQKGPNHRSSVVEHLAFNQVAVGSTPTGGVFGLETYWRDPASSDHEDESNNKSEKKDR
jgi:hypothetical protein